MTEEQLMKEATDEAIGVKQQTPYPLYQYSIFLGGNRDEQLVIRANTFTELIEAKKNIDKIVTKREQASASSQPPAQLTCNFCGERAEERQGVSKSKGKKYHGIFCSSGQKGHTVWL